MSTTDQQTQISADLPDSIVAEYFEAVTKALESDNKKGGRNAVQAGFPKQRFTVSLY